MGKVKSFVAGAALGAGAAILLAPYAGEQTRSLIAEKANAVAGEAKDFGAGFPASAQSAIKTAQDKAADLTGRAKQAAPATSAVTDDDLREKIEAARQRIAAQVAANAEQAKAAAEEVAEAAAEVAE